tara:strand:- start:217 stop:936 length:720 start_codon:yes stop_codon:yes gene_type:complete
MFSYAFIFITLTLISLVSAAFYLKAPKASIPLIIIYIIFIFNNKNSEVTLDKIEVVQPKSTIEESKFEFEKEPEPSFNDLATIKPKPITFDSDDYNDRKPKEVKKKTKPVEKLTKRPEIKKDVSNATLMVKDIKICKKIYKRTPVGSDIVFTNSVDSLYCYTRIQNTGSKKEVKHVWYFENEIMTQVRYNVRKSNIYRSWTKKTILPHQIGKWRVDVHDNHGTIIGSKEFKIKNISNYN